MYKLSEFTKTPGVLADTTAPFMQFLKTKWDELHTKPDVFRYKISNLKEKIICNKYLLQLNPERGINRRTPEQIDNICQEFNENKFNFTKISSKEIIISLVAGDDEEDGHLLVVNVSPISQYHTLLCPFVNKKLPQVVTQESLQLAINIIYTAQERNLRIGFNSLCAMASVNHLHYHLFVEKHQLHIENMAGSCHATDNACIEYYTAIIKSLGRGGFIFKEWIHIKGALYCINKDYPVQAFCFEVEEPPIYEQTKEIYKLLEYFLEKSIAHNILITSACSGRNDNSAQVVIFPRKGTVGVKQLTAFNVAVCELSGWFPVHDQQAFSTLTCDDIEKELEKWKLDNFENLCDEIKLLY